jgi:FkbM family methyltransferase
MMGLGSLILKAPIGRRTLLRVARKSCAGWLTPEVIEVEGLRLGLDLRCLPDRDYATGSADTVGLAFIVDHCPEAGIIVDGGANIGLYSLYAATRRPRATVLAVEPAPGIVARLRRNIALNGLENVIVCDCALAEEDGTRELMLNITTNTGGSSFVVRQAQFQGFEKTSSVRTTTLLRLLAENRVDRLDVLKLDVEGYEYPVLRKFFAEAPRSYWPRAMVVEAFGSSIPLVGGSTVQLVIGAGYQLVNHTAVDFFFEM